MNPDFISVTCGEGMVYAINQIVELISLGVDGIHIFTMNNPIVAGKICEGIKNLI